MHWDRKLGTLAGIVIGAAVLAVAAVIWWITTGSLSSGDRIQGRAEVGFTELTERVSDCENVGHTIISQRGKYSSQSKYEDFDEAWLTELTMVGYEFVQEDITYSHAVKFRLRTYDTENVYLPDDTRDVYGRYTDEVILFRNEDIYYGMYLSGNTEYRFIAECPSLTEWLEKIDG
jgi:hypothetical protein